MTDTNKSQLEQIIEGIPHIKKILSADTINKDYYEFTASLRNRIESHKTESGETLREIAIKNGREEEFNRHLDYVTGEKWKTLYKADLVLRKLEDYIGVTGGKGVPLSKVAIKWGEKKLLLGAYIAVYAAHKMVYQVLGEYEGLYSNGFKGRLSYIADDLGMQVNALGDIVGIGGLVNKLDLASIPKRIEDSAVRDMEYFAKTGTEYKSIQKRMVDKASEKLKTTVKKIGELVQYRHSYNNVDHRPAYETSYSIIHAQA